MAEQDTTDEDWPSLYEQPELELGIEPQENRRIHERTDL